MCETLDISLEQVAYVGDDLTDIPVLQSIGCPVTVADAIPENLKYSIYTTKMPGGKGAVREICELLLQVATPQSEKN